MRYALIDENKEFQLLFEVGIEKYLGNDTLIFYTNYEQFKNDLRFKNKHVDVLFIDVGNQKYDGYNIAKQLYVSSNNTIIIFLTSNDIQNSKLFGLNVLCTINKCDIFSQMKSLIDEINDLKSFCEVISIKSNQGTIHLNQNSITHVKLEKNDILVFNIQGDCFSVKHMTLLNFYNQLSQSYFYFVNRSTLININQVRNIIGDNIRLNDCTCHKISRGKKKEVIRIYSKSKFKCIRF